MPHSPAPLSPFDDLYADTAAFGRRLVLWVLAIALLGFPLVALAAPRAASAEECAHAADVAVTARALAEEGLPAERTAKVLERMYPKAVFAKWGEVIVKSAYADKRGAAQYASDLLKHCYTSQGNLDGFLGVAL